MRREDHEAIERTQLFEPLEPRLRARLLEGAFTQRLPRGAELFQQGEMPAFLHVVLEGRIGLVGVAADRRETLVEIFGAGEILIAPAVVLELPYLMSARVVDAARLVMIPAKPFQQALKEEPPLALALAQMLARHWRLLARQVKELKLKSAPQRLGCYLLAMTPKRSGGAMIRLPEDRRTAAARLGMTPESLSRAFGQLRAIGVAGSGRHVTISDLQTLTEYCQEDDLR
jgi:CRP/FNR family transcriptional activator FtrB